MIRDYIQLTKPGILRSNLLAAFAGFWLASAWSVDLVLLALTLLGTLLVMASSCVFNNFLDRDLDIKMARTRNRALPAGRLPAKHVLIYGGVLGALGLLVLLLGTNPLSALLGAAGMFVYVVLYTMWLKRSSTLSTVIGAFSGAMPPVIGYTAVSGTMDTGAWLLFAVMFLWQPPHFWALGIRRIDDYRAAGFRILPVVKGIRRTKIQMIPYVALLIPATALFYYRHYTGIIYSVVGVLMSAIWLAHCIAGLWTKNEQGWAKFSFLYSVNYLVVTFLVMIANTAGR